MANAETLKKVYFGEKANDSLKNPCKGECVTKCAVLYSEINAIDNMTSKIDEILYDADEITVIAQNSYIDRRPADMIIQELLIDPSTEPIIEIIGVSR